MGAALFQLIAYIGNMNKSELVIFGLEICACLPQELPQELFPQKCWT